MLDSISAEVTRLGGVVDKPEASKRGTALYATFEETGGVDKAIFWFPADDNIIHFRSERLEEPVWDGNANKKRLQKLKELLKLEDRVRDLTLADYTAVGRNAAGQIVAEREAADAALGVER